MAATHLVRVRFVDATPGKAPAWWAWCTCGWDIREGVETAHEANALATDHELAERPPRRVRLGHED